MTTNLNVKKADSTEISTIKKLFVAVIFDEKNYAPTDIHLVNPTEFSFIVSQIQGSYEEDFDLGWGNKESFEMSPHSYKLVDRVEDAGMLDFTTWYYFFITTEDKDAYRVSISWSGRILWNRERYEKENLPVLNKKGFQLDSWSFIQKFKEKGKLIVPSVYYCEEDYQEKYMNETAQKDPIDCLKTLKKFGGITEGECEEGLKIVYLIKNIYPKVGQKIDEEIASIINEVMWSEKMTEGRQLSEEKLKELRNDFIESLKEEKNIQEGKSKLPNEKAQIMKEKIISILLQKYKNK